MRVLFVCLGNICRSPAAENVMRHLLEADPGVDEGGWTLDSAGTIGFHQGSPPDARMKSALRRRGFPCAGAARKIQVADLQTFDLVVVMDRENERNVLQMAQPDETGKVRLLTSFCRRHQREDVPDPYHGGVAGFEQVLDLLEDGCGELLRQWKAGEWNQLSPSG
ncbi:MAG: low molecular weight protein-tyrosine-phosphatase [Verrucomicrobiota bacterium]